MKSFSFSSHLGLMPKVLILVLQILFMSFLGFGFAAAAGEDGGGGASAAPVSVVGKNDIDPALSSLMNQDETPEKIILQMARERMKEELKKLNAPDARVPSLLFTTEEQRGIDEALSHMGGANAAHRRQQENEPERYAPEKKTTKKKGIIRDIYLSGIVYRSSDDWVVWINKWRVTPKDVPSDIPFIRVTKEFVEMKWRDDETGGLVPLRLRAGQHYNLDTKSFITGGK